MYNIIMDENLDEDMYITVASFYVHQQVDYISFRFEFNGTVVYKGFFIELMEEMAKLLDFR